MTVKLKYCIYLSSFSVWLALSNQIASAQKINPLPKERYQNYTDYKSDNKQNSFTIKNTFREKLKEKFKNYVVESNNQAQNNSYPINFQVYPKRFAKGNRLEMQLIN
mgnify:CR=1 FL=1